MNCLIKRYLSILLVVFAVLQGWSAKVYNVQGKSDEIINLPVTAQFKTVEIPIAITKKYLNPYDADEVKVDLQIKDPFGNELILPCFYSEEFISVDPEKKQLSPSGQTGWLARFTPSVPGQYALKVSVSDREGQREGENYLLQVIRSETSGFIRKNNKHYFLFDNRTPFFAVGFNVSHPSNDKPLDYDYYFKKFSENGMNYSRVWLAPPWGPYSLALEWTNQAGSPQSGIHGIMKYNQEVAWRIDQMIHSAEKNGIYLMLCLGDEREWEESTPANREFWSTNPYNKLNGGPVSRSADFFRSKQAQKIYQNKLRYLIARWSASTSVFSWEFWNEIDHTKWCVDWSLVQNDLVSWHNLMGNFMSKNDPFQHPVSTSFCINNNRPEIWNLASMAYTQVHNYGGGENMAEVVVGKAKEFLNQYPDQPLLLSEFGTGWSGISKENDAELTGLHNAIWASTFCGTAGTAMWWWWTSLDRMNVYPKFKVLSDFVKTIPLLTVSPVTLTTNSEKVLVLGLTNSRSSWIWVQNRDHNWSNVQHGVIIPSIKKVQITIPGLPVGNYTIKELDTNTGNTVRTFSSQCINRKLDIEIDELQRDIAFEIHSLK